MQKETKLTKETNELLKKINNNLELTYNVEDYSEDDLEEYGIGSLEETYHYSLVFFSETRSSATVIVDKLYFNQKRSLTFDNYAKRALHDKGLTRNEIGKVGEIIKSKILK